MMSRIILTFALLTLVSIGAAPSAVAKSWRQITPLHSTAKDVGRVSHGCENAEIRCQFTLGDEEVMVIFSGGTIGVSGDDAECKQVPKQTVLAVIINFSKPQKLRAYKVNNERFRTFDPSSPPGAGYKTYYDAQDGFLINTYKGQVVGLVYLATQKDTHLCPEYYEDPKAFVEVGLFP